MPEFNDKQKKIVASILYEQYGASQKNLGKAFGNISQSTMSSWIKEGKLLLQIESAKKDAQEWKERADNLHKELKALGFRRVDESIDIDEVGEAVERALDLKE